MGVLGLDDNGECRILAEKTASDVMSSPVLTVSPEDTISKAARLMYEGNVGSVVVVDDMGKAVGILTRRDIIYLVAMGLTRRDPLVRIYMKEPVLYCQPDDTLKEVLRRMKAAGVRHIVVSSEPGKAPLGIVSMYDILTTLAGACLDDS